MSVRNLLQRVKNMEDKAGSPLPVSKPSQSGSNHPAEASRAEGLIPKSRNAMGNLTKSSKKQTAVALEKKLQQSGKQDN